MKEIAKITGGEYFRATDGSALQAVYHQIDRLEPAAGTQQWLRPADEWFTWPLAAALILSLPAAWNRGAHVALKVLGGLHFLHPWWLLALPPLLTLSGWLGRAVGRDGGWSRVMDADLLPLLRMSEKRRGQSPWLLVGTIWSLAVLALAGAGMESPRNPRVQVAIRLGVDPRPVSLDGRDRHRSKPGDPSPLRGRRSARFGARRSSRFGGFCG